MLGTESQGMLQEPVRLAPRLILARLECETKIMKVLVLKRETPFYFGQAESWTPDVAHAHDFKNTLSAIDFLEAARMSDGQIVLKFPDDRYDILLDFQARTAPARAAFPAYLPA